MYRHSLQPSRELLDLLDKSAQPRGSYLISGILSDGVSQALFTSQEDHQEMEPSAMVVHTAHNIIRGRAGRNDGVAACDGLAESSLRSQAIIMGGACHVHACTAQD